MTTMTSHATDARPEKEYVITTLLDLVAAVSDVADTDAEVVATVRHMMESGRVRLIGHFTEADFGLAA